MTGTAVRSRPNNLPAELTSFVGRRKQLSEVKRLLSTTRLLTLTGSGGAGKTRLALRAAAEVTRSFADGVWFVSLASIDDPQLVVQAVFGALGLQDRSSGWSLSALGTSLAAKHLLLVLDNCEHLLDSCALLAVTVLTSCPNLRILATSRQALGVTGETRMRVPPLSLPEDGETLTPERLTTYEAVALLSERAAAVVPGFKVDGANSAAVLGLCRRLDGLPLALELAAVRFEGLTVEQVMRGLESNLPVLAKGTRGAEARQQTLEATIGWSYGLLDGPEQLLWARLSVFAGGFDEDAVMMVCAGPDLPPDAVAGTLASLVEKSVLKRDPDRRPARYLILDTIRQFGRQRLRETGEEIEIQARHRDWILELSAAASAWDHGQADALHRIHRERDNVWAALDFCLRQPSEAAAGIEICRNLHVYWQVRGPFGDVRRMVAALCELVEHDSLARAEGLWLGASLAITQSDMDAAAPMLADSLRIGRQVGDLEVIGWSTNYLAVIAWVQGRLEEASAHLEASLELARPTNRDIVIGALNVQAYMALLSGRPDRVIAPGEEGLSLSREAGELWARGMLLNALSQARWQQSESRAAEELAREGAAVKHALHDFVGLAVGMESLAMMAAERGAAERAAVLLGSGELMRESVATPIFAAYREQHERSTSSAHTQLGDAAYRLAFERGRSMAIDEAVAFAVGEKQPGKAAPAAKVAPSSLLTQRELEIAHLIAEGLTSQQIATKLFISERTVTTHVTNMLNKLGLSSRIQLASWVTGC